MVIEDYYKKIYYKNFIGVYKWLMETIQIVNLARKLE